MNFVRWQWGLISGAVLTIMSVAGCVPASSDVGDAANPTTDATEQESTPGPIEGEPAPINPQLLAQGQILPVTAEVDLGGETIGLEVAKTPQQQATGLMARESLADDRGMLFPFEPARPVSFWMKNVLISLDMVFVYNDEIVAIATDVPPCESDPCPTYGPDNQRVDYVIELRGGLADELGLQAGDPVEIEWLESTTDAAPESE